MTASPDGLCPYVNYRDFFAASSWLQALGFQPGVMLVDKHDVVLHEELLWPGGGAVLIGSAKDSGTEYEALPTGVAGLWIRTDDVDGVWERATSTTAEVVRPLGAHDGSARSFTVRDHEGNLWSFGTAYGLPRPA